MPKRILTMFAALFLAITMVQAQNVDDAKLLEAAGRAEKAWRGWIAEIGATRSQFAFAHRGKIILRTSIGVQPDADMPLFSLSKAITGQCVLRLARSGQLSLDATIGSVVADLAEGLGGGITVSQLLTNTSGLKPDITQGVIHKWLGDGEERLHQTARDALLDANISKDRRAYFYNNGNYAVLGALIEAATGQPYAKACAEEAKGMTLGHRYAPLSAYGGWSGSATDYLMFAHKAFGDGSRAQADPFKLPHVEIGDGAFYGPGVLLRKGRRTGANFWHFGLLCNPDPADDGGSYFAVLGNGLSVAVTHNVCPEGELVSAIDLRVWQAVFDR